MKGLAVLSGSFYEVKMSKINENIIKAIDLLIEKRLKKVNYDITFSSVVYEVHDNGTYTIIKDNQRHRVKCAIPNLDIKIGTQVWVKIPCNKLRDMHICGLIK